MKNQQDNIDKDNIGQDNMGKDNMEPDNMGKDNMEPDNMGRDNIEYVLREELKREGREIQKEIDASDIEDLSESKQAEILAKLQERIARHEKESEMEAAAELTDMDIYARLSAEDREALELGRKVKEERRHARKKRTWKMYAAVAASIVLVFTGGMTSMGGPERIVSVVKQAIGGREVTQVDSSESNMILENEDEERAYQEIEDTFGVEPVKPINSTEGIRFAQMDLDKSLQVAELLYHYNGENILYLITANFSNASFGMDIEDKIIEQEKVYNSGNEIELTVYEIEKNKEEKCAAKFKYRDLEYYLVGTIEKEEFKKILENLYFS